MNCPRLRPGIILIVTLLIVVLPAVGCREGLFTVAYLFKGNDIDPDFAELKGKTVAVVCRPVASRLYANSNVGRELAQQISLLLQEKVPKIKVIDQRKIAKWTDENTWDEYPEVAKAMKADMVVGVDLESFSLYLGQTLYQGKANASDPRLRLQEERQGGLPQEHSAVHLSAERGHRHVGADRAGLPQRVRRRAGRPDRTPFL